MEPPAAWLPPGRVGRACWPAPCAPSVAMIMWTWTPSRAYRARIGPTGPGPLFLTQCRGSYARGSCDSSGHCPPTEACATSQLAQRSVDGRYRRARQSPANDSRIRSPLRSCTGGPAVHGGGAGLLAVDRRAGARHARIDDRRQCLDDDAGLGWSTPGAALGDVGRHDAGHDAAICVTDAADLRSHRATFRSRSARGVASDLRHGRRLSGGLVHFQRRRNSRPTRPGVTACSSRR